MTSASFLGLETGGTKLVASVLNTEQGLLATVESSRPREATAGETMTRLVALAGEARAKAGAGGVRIAATGWGFGGPVDRGRNRPAVNFHEPGWEEFDAGTALAAELGTPVFVENDCKVAGLAEAFAGAGSVQGLTAYLTLGSGVGGGLIWNGRILDSGPFGECEIGHLCVEPNGARCACGRCGCLEAYCSAWGVGERAAEAARAWAAGGAVAGQVLGADPRQRSGVLFDGWPHDPFSQRQIEEFLARLAGACAALCLLVAPARVVLGGGLARRAWLAEALAERVEARLPAVMRGHTRFAHARLGARSVSWGAALYARERLGPQRGVGGRAEVAPGNRRAVIEPPR